MEQKSDLTRRDLLLLIAGTNKNHFSFFDLSGVRLSGDFSNMNFRGFNFQKATLHDCDFRGCNFGIGHFSARFDECDVSRCWFDDDAPIDDEIKRSARAHIGFLEREV